MNNIELAQAHLDNLHEAARALLDDVFTAQRDAELAAEQRFRDFATHLSHCNMGEHAGRCKYGKDDCPALTEAWCWLGQAIDRGAGRALAAYMPAAAHERVVAALTSAIAYFNGLAQAQTLGLDPATDNVRQSLCEAASILSGEVLVGNLRRTEETRAAMREAAALAFIRPAGE